MRLGAPEAPPRGARRSGARHRGRRNVARFRRLGRRPRQPMAAQPRRPSLRFERSAPIRCRSSWAEPSLRHADGNRHAVRRIRATTPSRLRERPDRSRIRPEPATRFSALIPKFRSPRPRPRDVGVLSAPVALCGGCIVPTARCGCRRHEKVCAASRASRARCRARCGNGLRGCSAVAAMRGGVSAWFCPESAWMAAIRSSVISRRR